MNDDYNEHLGREFRNLFSTDLANEDLDELMNRAGAALDATTDAAVVEGLFPPQPDYSANMPEYSDWQIAVMKARATVDEWQSGDDGKAAVDKRLARLEADAIKRRDRRGW